MSQFYHTRSPNIRIIHFWGTSGCCMGIIWLHTFTKSNLAVILRDQPSFYNHPFTRYGFCDFFCPARVIFRLFPANRPWPKIWHQLFLTLLESYNRFLKRKWIYMEVHTGGNSAPAYMNFIARFVIFNLLKIIC